VNYTFSILSAGCLGSALSFRGAHRVGSSISVSSATRVSTGMSVLDTTVVSSSVSTRIGAFCGDVASICSSVNTASMISVRFAYRLGGKISTLSKTCFG
jgi:hypothetical protein